MLTCVTFFGVMLGIGSSFLFQHLEKTSEHSTASHALKLFCMLEEPCHSQKQYSVLSTLNIVKFCKFCPCHIKHVFRTWSRIRQKWMLTAGQNLVPVYHEEHRNCVENFTKINGLGNLMEDLFEKQDP